MICRRCSHPNEDGAHFCSSCGAELPADETTLSIAAVGGQGDEGGAPGASFTELPAGTAVVVVRRGPNAGSTFGLDADTTAAGRHPESPIFLDDITVSRRHAVIERASDGWALSDVGSLNGTYVNHRRVERAVLHDGDEIQIGRYVLTFHTGSIPG